MRPDGSDQTRLTNNDADDGVIVTPLTTTRRALSLHVEVEPSPPTGLDEASYVQCELIRSINSKFLVHRLGSIDTETSHQVATVMRTLLDY